MKCGLEFYGDDQEFNDHAEAHMLEDQDKEEVKSPIIPIAGRVVLGAAYLTLMAGLGIAKLS